MHLCMQTSLREKYERRSATYNRLSRNQSKLHCAIVPMMEKQTHNKKRPGQRGSSSPGNLPGNQHVNVKVEPS